MTSSPSPFLREAEFSDVDSAAVVDLRMQLSELRACLDAELRALEAEPTLRSASRVAIQLRGGAVLIQRIRQWLLAGNASHDD